MAFPSFSNYFLGSSPLWQVIGRFCQSKNGYYLSIIGTVVGGGYLWYRFSRKLTWINRLWLGDAWYSEVSPCWPGQAFSLTVEKILYKGTSDFQECLCFENEIFGRVLVLDGAIQCTERDECAYHEVMVNLALNCHPHPKNVLVVGGGDGGTVREICRHEDVERVDVCELDEMVIRISQAYLPEISKGLEDPRVRIIIEDGFTFVRDHPKQYDVIFVDSSDPVGPAKILFTNNFYKALHNALGEDGIAITQAECMWLHFPIIKQIFNAALTYFAYVDYAHISVPTYPCGSIGFACCSKKYSCQEPQKEMAPTLSDQMKYYSINIHRACFVLPQFLQKKIDSIRSQRDE
ncbi:putative Spermidine synthase [Cardiosporidium cionae]|uniref:Spermidine synthase n=1 Tax=Cardiosporidium cionae TaxID=476202 RepID=A0ABQ7JBP6_9APIC|nr:putative Spermidine synthase [Cardiosporidium cionae]|eukprot:KAF8821432.1 putative Spermidine synthase [Cardiosporidium cionae]